MVMEHSNGQTEENISANGAKENNTEREYTSKKGRKDKASGTWAKGQNGLRTLLDSSDVIV